MNLRFIALAQGAFIRPFNSLTSFVLVDHLSLKWRIFNTLWEQSFWDQRGTICLYIVLSSGAFIVLFACERLPFNGCLSVDLNLQKFGFLVCSDDRQATARIFSWRHVIEYPRLSLPDHEAAHRILELQKSLQVRSPRSL